MAQILEPIYKARNESQPLDKVIRFIHTRPNRPLEQETIDEDVRRLNNSRMFVEVGKQVSVENLLQGMIVQSGNDATVALAEYVGGTEATPEDWRFLHRCYVQTYAERGRQPYLNLDFFQRLARSFADHVVLVMAEQRGRPVSKAGTKPAR